MDKPKIMLCPLVTDDYPRAERAIRSAFTQRNHNLDYGVHVVINSKNPIFTHKNKNFKANDLKKNFCFFSFKKKI
jgi:hypothetical protein